ncbi:MAG: SRPBCC family protein [Prolixibacteraceae bacterium]
MGFYQIHTTQKIPATLDEVWDFIAKPGNLKRITPEYMGFDITSGNEDEEMHPGMIISYKVSPVFGIKMTWVTEITHVREKEYFVDEQRVGPYSMWHHKHKIEEIEGGVLMTDIVSYRPPLGFIGNMVNTVLIKKQLKEIFDFRKKAVEEYFGKM